MINVNSKNSGNSLVIIMMLVAAISTIVMATAGNLWRDKNRLNHNYIMMLAVQSAESGIELAKNEMDRGSSGKKKYEFRYDGEHFTQISGKTIECEVIAWKQPDGAFFDSRATIYNLTHSREKGMIIAQRKVKQSTKIKKTHNAHSSRITINH